MGHLVQAHPQPEVAGDHLQRPLDRDDVGRHQQQGAVLAGERVVLAEDRGGHEREHRAGLQPGRYAGQPAAVRAGRPGELGHRVGGGVDPAGPVDDPRGRHRQAVGEAGDRPDGCLRRDAASASSATAFRRCIARSRGRSGTASPRLGREAPVDGPGETVALPPRGRSAFEFGVCYRRLTGSHRNATSPRSRRARGD